MKQIPKYILSNAFYGVVDDKNKLYYVSMNYQEAMDMKTFYEELNKDNPHYDLKFKVISIGTNSHIEIIGGCLPTKQVDIKLKEKIMKGSL